MPTSIIQTTCWKGDVHRDSSLRFPLFARDKRNDNFSFGRYVGKVMSSEIARCLWNGNQDILDKFERSCILIVKLLIISSHKDDQL